jgi:hypothetical protein
MSVPRLCLLGNLSEPNSEHLVEVTVDGRGLRRLIGLQLQLMFFERLGTTRGLGLSADAGE